MLVTFAIDEEARVVGGFINIYYRGPRNRTSSGRHIEIRVKRNNGASLPPSFFQVRICFFFFFFYFISLFSSPNSSSRNELQQFFPFFFFQTKRILYSLPFSLRENNLPKGRDGGEARLRDYSVDGSFSCLNYHRQIFAKFYRIHYSRREESRLGRG